MSQRHRTIVLADGTVVLDITGADSGNESDDTDNEDADIDDEGDDEDGDDEETVDSLKEKLAEAEEAKARAERRMKMADKAKTREVKKRQALEAAAAGNKPKPKASTTDSDDVDADNDKVASLEHKIEELQQKLAERDNDPKPRIYDAFRDTDEIQWHDRKLAFDQLDLSEVEVDDDGTVDTDALLDAMKDLAKKRPYLVKKSETNDEEDGDDEDPAPKAPSGRNPGKRRTNNNVDRKTLEKQFPVLRTRS